MKTLNKHQILRERKNNPFKIERENYSLFLPS